MAGRSTGWRSEPVASNQGPTLGPVPDIAALSQATAAELRKIWQTRRGSAPPPTLSARIMRHALAWDPRPASGDCGQWAWTERCLARLLPKTRRRGGVRRAASAIPLCEPLHTRPHHLSQNHPEICLPASSRGLAALQSRQCALFRRVCVTSTPRLKIGGLGRGGFLAGLSRYQGQVGAAFPYSEALRDHADAVAPTQPTMSDACITPACL